MRSYAFGLAGVDKDNWNSLFFYVVKHPSLEKRNVWCEVLEALRVMFLPKYIPGPAFTAMTCTPPPPAVENQPRPCRQSEQLHYAQLVFENIRACAQLFMFEQTVHTRVQFIRILCHPLCLRRGKPGSLHQALIAPGDMPSHP